MNHESILELLRQAEKQLLELDEANKNRASMPLLHTAKIHIWKAMDDLRAAVSEGMHE